MASGGDCRSVYDDLHDTMGFPEFLDLDLEFS
jgi:hypothetical protein